MTARQELAAAIRPFAPGGKLQAEHIPAFDALADALGLPRDVEGSADDETVSLATAHLRLEEGVRHRAYKDHLGYWTTGVGRLIDPRRGGRIRAAEERVLMANDPSRKKGDWTSWVLNDDEVDYLLANDVAETIGALENDPRLKAAWAKVEGNPYRATALISMAFQLGYDGLAGFRNTLALIAAGAFDRAADNALKSLWARQTPGRAKRVTDMLRKGAAS